MNDINIGNKRIGNSIETFIIAEIGSNHNQSLELAFETIDAAQEAGADAVKFQSINIDKLYLSPSEETMALHRKIDMPEEWHSLLKNYCDKKKILFFSSPTYLEAVDILESIEVKLYKLASAQIGTFPQLVKRVAETGKPVILSTGLVNYGELEKVVRIFQKAGNNNYIILHCNSIYPTPYEKVNLHLMDVYKGMFGCVVGFSDHTPDIYMPIIAVAQGAKVIEKHFAMSRTLPVPDAEYSLEPNEFKRMVEGIRAAEVAKGTDYRIEIQPEENNFKNRIRTRLVLNKAKEAGSILSERDFHFRRSEEGIDCSELEFILGKKLIKDKRENTLLSKNEVQ
jgi:sialic acid synthase SpsE